MFCEKCGKKLPEGTSECPFCNTEKYGGNNANLKSMTARRTFRFSKDKGFSSCSYKSIETTAELDLDSLTLDVVERTTWFAFFERPKKEYIITLDQIASIGEKRTWDFWDLVFAAMIVFLSKLNSVFWLLLALLFIWTAAGWRIKIVFKDGTAKKIQYSGFRADCEFVNAVQQYLDQADGFTDREKQNAT